MQERELRREFDAAVCAEVWGGHNSQGVTRGVIVKSYAHQESSIYHNPLGGTAVVKFQLFTLTSSLFNSTSM